MPITHLTDETEFMTLKISPAKLTLTALLLGALTTSAVRAADEIAFWNTPEKGGNSFNRLPPDSAYFAALHGYGASWVRLSYDKWHHLLIRVKFLSTVSRSLNRSAVALPGMNSLAK